MRTQVLRDGLKAGGQEETNAYLEILGNWMKEQVIARERSKISCLGLLKTSRDRRKGRAMIAEVLTGYGD